MIKSKPFFAAFLLGMFLFWLPRLLMLSDNAAIGNAVRTFASCDTIILFPVTGFVYSWIAGRDEKNPRVLASAGGLVALLVFLSQILISTIVSPSLFIQAYQKGLSGSVGNNPTLMLFVEIVGFVMGSALIVLAGAFGAALSARFMNRQRF
jgi:hypothetical protein